MIFHAHCQRAPLGFALITPKWVPWVFLSGQVGRRVTLTKYSGMGAVPTKELTATGPLSQRLFLATGITRREVSGTSFGHVFHVIRKGGPDWNAS